jgi:hypothetical protein
VVAVVWAGRVLELRVVVEVVGRTTVVGARLLVLKTVPFRVTYPVEYDVTVDPEPTVTATVVSVSAV